MNDLPKTIPIFPLARALLLPKGTLPLMIFENRYLAMVNDVLQSNRMFGMVQPEKEHAPQSLYPIGCLGRISSLGEADDGRLLITLSGLNRFHIEKECQNDKTYRQVKVNYQEFLNDLEPEPNEDKIQRDELLEVLRNYLDQNGLQANWDAIKQAPSASLVTVLSTISPYDIVEKQALLEAKDSVERCALLIDLTKMVLAQNDKGAFQQSPTTLQ